MTSPTEDATLGAFLERYPPRAYVRRNPGGSDYPGAELAPVTSADGLLHLAGVPTSVPKGSPPTRTGDGTNGVIEQALQKQREELGVTQRQLASAADKSLKTVERAEQDADQLELREIEHLAFVLGLDPAKLSIDERAGADPELGVRLRVLETESQASLAGARLSPRTVLRFSEAASIIRSQLQLQRWLKKPDEAAKFKPSADYGRLPYMAGYNLAEHARERLRLGLEPIDSLRGLAEERLGIPIIQVKLPTAIAGATVSAHGQRGIVLNTAGRNSNVWIRRTTLAHELGHILFDPEEELSNVRVDSYDEVARNAEHGDLPRDVVEQRANAFAVEFLAPSEGVKSLVPSPASVSATSIAEVMSVFGIGPAAARFHVGNAWWGQAQLPAQSAIRGGGQRRATGSRELHAGLLPASGNTGTTSRAVRFSGSRGGRFGAYHHGHGSTVPCVLRGRIQQRSPLPARTEVVPFSARTCESFPWGRDCYGLRYMRKTPQSVAGMGALRAAEMPMERTRRVSRGSMTPSSQRRALLK